MQKLTLGLATLLVMITSGAQAADSKKAMDAYNSGDFETAFAEYSVLAEEGDAVAQYNLGVMYDEGEGVELDDAAAVKWYTLSAEQGDAKAQYNLALMYDEGEGVELDDVEAVKWYRASAKQGDSSAQFNLAVMYYNGEGVEEDNVSARMWFGVAEANGADNASDALDTVAKHMSSAEITRADIMARECMGSKYTNCGN